MTPERWARIEALFDAALALPEPERAPFLEREAEDAELRGEVDSLLGADRTADALIEELVGSGAGAALAQASLAGRRLGPYRLVRELGRGGMGAVYLALRDDDEYRTEVAIKVLHRGLETEAAVARFRDERQILATLEHPGIVRLLDGGSTDDGLPYLVMEHVAGVPITAWADERRLSVAARVALFRKVCDAVGYAHGRLIVHRDLKPQNILVDQRGDPKLLDFGIARLLDDVDRQALTRTGAQLLTPGYASPEQVRGEPVSTAADVYALLLVI
jgi:serine/threonine protein kinase